MKEIIDVEEITDNDEPLYDDDEMIDERQRKKRTHPAVIVIILMPIVFFIAFSIYGIGWQMNVVKDFDEETKERIINSYGLSQEAEFEIKSLSAMHYALAYHFYVLELKVEDFQAFREANEYICQNSYRFLTENFSLIFPVLNFKPVPNDEQIRYTVFYADDTVYISIYTWEAKWENNDISEYFWEIEKKQKS